MKTAERTLKANKRLNWGWKIVLTFPLVLFVLAVDAGYFVDYKCLECFVTGKKQAPVSQPIGRSGSSSGSNTTQALRLSPDRNSSSNVFIDKSVVAFPDVQSTEGVFQLISHGRPGELFIDGEWRNEKQIAAFLKLRIESPSGKITHLNIYGCNFAQGAVGEQAVGALQNDLGISVAASNNITGKGGDWTLEVGQPLAAIAVSGYEGNLQCSGTLWTPTLSELSVPYQANYAGYPNTINNLISNLPANATLTSTVSGNSMLWYAETPSTYSVANLQQISPDYYSGGFKNQVIINPATSINNLTGISLWAPAIGTNFGDAPLRQFTVTVTHSGGTWTSSVYMTAPPTADGSPALGQYFPFGQSFSGVTNVTLNTLNGWFNTNAAQYSTGTTWISTTDPQAVLDWGNNDLGYNMSLGALRLNTGSSVVPQPTLYANTISNSCPLLTANLTTLENTSAIPAGTTLVWSLHNSPTSTSDILTTAQAQAISTSGTVYAYYLNTSTGCFSPASAVSVTINTLACCAYGLYSTRQYATSVWGSNATYGTNAGGVGAPNITGAALDYSATTANEAALYNASDGGMLLFNYVNPIVAGDTLLISVREYAGYTGSFTIGLIDNSQSTTAKTTLATIPYTSSTISTTSGTYSLIKYVVPATATGSYNSVTIKSDPNVILFIDAIGVTYMSCNSCPAGVNAPTLSTTSVVLCSGQSVDLTAFTAGNLPAGSKISWHTGTPATAANEVPNLTDVSASSFPSGIGSITFYAAFKDLTSSCYSGVNGNGIATTAVTVILDSDCDIIPNTDDLDDDNDGILDAVESPGCFYTATEANTIKAVTTGLTINTGSTPLLYNGVTVSASPNFSFTAGQQLAGSNIFTVEYVTPVKLTSLNIVNATSLGTSSTASLFGSNDRVVWTDLMTGTTLLSTTTTKTLTVNQNAGEYIYYRVQGEATATTIANPIFELTGVANTTNYIPSAHPKPSCTGSDADGDGIPNYLDLDSDGDGCPDAKEASVIGTLLPGDLVNLSGTTASVTDAIAQGPYGANGFANALETSTESGVYSGTYTYSNATTAGSSSTITTQPADQSVAVGGTATYTVTATGGSGTRLYQWQVSTDGGATWTNVINGGVYTGASTSSLTITGAAAIMAGYKYKVVVSQSNYACANVVSGVVDLCIIPSAPTVGTITQPTCANLSGSVVLNGLPASVTWSIFQSGSSTTIYTGTGTSTTITGLAPGNYTFTVGTAVGCTASSSTIVSIDGTIVNSPDSDGDGINDACDLDDDNDGITDIAEGYCATSTTYTLDMAATAAAATVGVNGGSFDLIYKLNAGNIAVPGLGASFTVTFTYSDFNNFYGADNQWASVVAVNSFGIGNVVGVTPSNTTLYKGLPPNNSTAETSLPVASPNTPDGVWRAMLANGQINQLGTFTVTLGNLPTLSTRLASISNATAYLSTAYNEVNGATGWTSGYYAKLNLQNTIFATAAAGTEPYAVLYGGTYLFDYTAFSNGTNVSNAGRALAALSNATVTYCIHNDADGDGIPNYLDLDSDGDGCPDAKEASVIGTLLPGDIVNTSGTSSVADAIAKEPYGANGLADGVETTPESGSYNGTYTYQNASSFILNICEDTDGDGVGDLIDLDDDNDGILDTEECTTVYSVASVTDPTNNGANPSTVYDASFTNSIDGKPYTFTYTNTYADPRISTGFASYPGNAGLTLLPSNQTVYNLIDGNTDNTYTFTFASATTQDYYFLLTALDKTQISFTNGVIVKYTLNGSINSSGTTYSQPNDIPTLNEGGLTVLIPKGTTVFSWSTLPGTDNYFAILATCQDTDSDGIPNSLDLDSDGDSCPDAKEASVIGTLLPGDIVNTSGTLSVADAIAQGDYGVNGFANGVETAPESGSYSGTYTYSNAITVGSSSTITTQPTDQSVAVGGTATFTVTATGGSGARLYQWQVSTDGGAAWTNVTNGGVYSGAGTSTLTINGTTTTMSEYQYRVVLSESTFVCAHVISSLADLCVIPSAPIVGTITQPTCTVFSGSVIIDGLPSSGTWTMTQSGTSIATYTGSGTSYTITGLGAGTYTFTVSNVSGCTSSPSVSVTIDGTIINSPDSDGDGIRDACDLDDDNDGILDAVECNSVDLLATDGTFPTWGGEDQIGSGWTIEGTYASSGFWTSDASRIAFDASGLLFKRDTGTETSIKHNITGTFLGTTITLSNLYWVKTPVSDLTTIAILDISYGGVIYATINSTTGDTPMITVSNGAAVNINALPSVTAGGGYYTSGKANLTILLPNNVPTSGTLRLAFTAGSNATEVRDFGMSSVSIVSCQDADGDGIPNYLDLDSDGDGCPDAKEAGVTGTLLPGNIVNTSGSLNVADAIAQGDYGGNGFANPLETSSESGTYNGSYTYSIAVTAGTTSTITTQPADQSVAIGGTATFNVTASGGSGTRLYQWQESTDGATSWTNVSNSGVYSGANTATLTITGATTTMAGYKYQVILSESTFVCDNVVSGIANLCVIDTPTVGTITQPTCTVPTGSVVLSGLPASGTWTIIQSGTSGSTYTGSGTGYTVTGLAEGSYSFTATSSTGCTSSSSATVTINAQPVTPAAPTVASVSPICSGQTAMFTLSGTAGDIVTYAINGGASASATIGLSGTATVTVANATVSQTISLTKVNNANCELALTGVTSSVIVNPVTAITTQPLATQTICLNITPRSLTVVATGTILIYQWYSNTTNSTTGGTLISGANSATFNPPTTTAGTKYYYVVVAGTCGTVTSTVSTVIVTTSSTTMNPVATATTEQCGGSNTGSITLSMPAGQGLPPYTYQTVSGTTMLAPATNIYSTSYTFQPLAPGSYRVSVTDACGQFQSRDVTLFAGSTHTNAIRVWAYSSSDCGTTDYYVQPQIGAYYPMTFYAYPNGDLNQTPYTITFTSNSEQVPVPSLTGQPAFKWTLPTPSPWLNGKYAFKYTDICNTDVTSAQVQPVTNTLGDYRVTTSVSNCKTNIDVWVGNGYTFPVTVTATPQGGTSIVQQITDTNSRTTTFTDVTIGITYSIVITDACSRTITTQRTIGALNLSINPYPGCGGNLDGVKNIDFTVGSGWQSPVSASITSGPASYHSTLLNQDIAATYPVSVMQSGDGVIRFANLAPGTYNLHLNDGCNQVDYPFTITNVNLQSFNFQNLVAGGCYGGQYFKSTATIACGSMYADVRTAANGVVANGYSSGTFTQTISQPGTYNVYYYMSHSGGEVFVNPYSYLNNTSKALINTLAVTVPTLDHYPSIGSYAVADCGGSGIQVVLYKSSSSPDIATYSIEYTSGQGDYLSAQSSNIFTLANYGPHAYVVTDVCGNGGTGFVNIEPNVLPTFSGTCLSGDVTLQAATQTNTTNSWKYPDGTIVTSNSLLLESGVAPSGIYELNAVHRVGSCTETKTATFWLPEPTEQYSDITIQCVTTPYEFTVPVDGTASVTMQWYKDGTAITGQTSNTLSVDETGLYKLVLISEGLSCTFEYSKNITYNPIPATPLLGTVTQPTCLVSTGSFMITNYDASYSYEVFPSAGVTVSGTTVIAPDGTYTITATSSTGCTSSPSTSITVNAQPATPSAPTLSSVTQPTCLVSTGSFTITNYNASYTYTISPSMGTSISGNTVTAPAGTYSVTATSSEGCTSSWSVSVTINPQPSTPDAPLLSSVIQPTCSIATGSFTITNYDASYSYMVFPSAGATVSGTTVIASEGTYTITATSSAGCTSSSSVSVTINSQPVTPEAPTLSTVTQPTCAQITGSFTISNYDASYTYNASPSTGVTISGNKVTAPAGTYTLTATNSVNCTSLPSELVTVNVQPDGPVATISPIGSVCANIQTIPLYGSPLGGTFSGDGVSDGTFNPATAGAGSHVITYTYTNSLGCVAIANTTINVLATATDLAVSPATQTVCSGNPAVLSVTGENGATISWAPNILLPPGSGTTYSTGALYNSGNTAYNIEITATAELGTCTSKAIGIVTVLPEPLVTIFPVSAVVCSYETPHFTLTSATVGTAINWQLINNADNSVVQSGSGTDSVTLFGATIPSGNYTLKVTGQKDGCTSRIVTASLVVN